MSATVVILAAGCGSRLGDLTKDNNKCSIEIKNGDSTVTRLIKQFNHLIHDPKFVVVLGYKARTVSECINKTFTKSFVVSKISYCYNEYYQERSCLFSLLTTHPLLESHSQEDLYIVEGDSVYSTENLLKLVASGRSSSLVRSDKFLSKRSVVCLEESNGKIIKYCYDPSHKKSPLSFLESSSSEPVYLKDNMQVWKICKEDTKIFVETLGRTPGSICFPETTSNVDIFNYLISQRLESPERGVLMESVRSDDPEGWVNLNERKDFESAKILFEKDPVLQ